MKQGFATYLAFERRCYETKGYTQTIIASDEFGILTVVCSSKPGRKKKPKKHDHDAKQPREEKHELTCNAGGIHSAQPHS